LVREKRVCPFSRPSGKKGGVTLFSMEKSQKGGGRRPLRIRKKGISRQFHFRNDSSTIILLAPREEKGSGGGGKEGKHADFAAFHNCRLHLVSVSGRIAAMVAARKKRKKKKSVVQDVNRVAAGKARSSSFSLHADGGKKDCHA